MDDFKMQVDLETTRVLELDNNKIYAKRFGEHGFWKLNLDKGQLPERLLGAYTTADHALAAAKIWAEEKKRTVVAEHV